MSLARNTRWAALAQIGRVAFQLIAIFAFARLLTPGEYGIVAMAAIVTNFALILRDLGTSAALIQRKEIDDVLISTVLAINIITGVLLCLLIVGASDFLARQFDSPELRIVLIFLALGFPVNSFAGAHQAIMERESRFKELARIELTSGLLSLIAALLCALCGLGVLSLVVQSLMMSVLSATQIILASGWTRLKRPRLSAAKSIWKFSGGLTGFSVINYFSRNADSIIIGKYLGAFALGPYSLAYRSMLFPVQSITFVLSRAMYPILSRSARGSHEAKSIYLQTLGIIAFLVAPLAAGLFAVRLSFVDVFFGEKWGVVSQLLFWMAPTGLIQAIVSTSGAVFMANERTNLQLMLGFFSMLMQVGAFAIGVNYGIVRLAEFYFYANVFNAVMTLHFSNSLMNVEAVAMLKKLFPSFFSAAAMAVILSAVMQIEVGNEIQHLCVGIIVGAICYFSIMRLCFRTVLKDALSFARNA